MQFKVDPATRGRLEQTIWCKKNSEAYAEPFICMAWIGTWSSEVELTLRAKCELDVHPLTIPHRRRPNSFAKQAIEMRHFVEATA